MSILFAFLVGGVLCLIGQLIMDLTPYNISTGHILVGYVTTGAIVSAFGLSTLIDFSVPGPPFRAGFGHG